MTVNIIFSVVLDHLMFTVVLHIMTRLLLDLLKDAGDIESEKSELNCTYLKDFSPNTFLFFTFFNTKVS